MNAIYRYLLAVIFFSLCLSIETKAQSVYDIPLIDIDDNSVQLNTYQGRKMVFVMLTGKADSLASQLRNFVSQTDSSVFVCGIVSNEDGFNPGEKAQLKTFFDGKKVLLTKAVSIRKSGSQHPLAKWLTDKDMNKHFQVETIKTGYKFFVSKEGVLQGMFPSEVPFTAAIIGRWLNK